ncbi:hypothetical protein ADICYQ_0201 [Cyclobacterium qasimii M12-11B]|uniref:Uncharacterized protein n=1 Tax=Cyclobacterium qasimii M12-11B TaxID=641524 RepID=S7X634_9BACT|nr:hypothetical protein ADICYQ_0201 [Cyclobacterium qasimii M12-11B]
MHWLDNHIIQREFLLSISLNGKFSTININNSSKKEIAYFI